MSFLSTQDYCYSPRFDNKSEYTLWPFSCPMNNDVTWQLLLNTYGEHQTNFYNLYVFFGIKCAFLAMTISVLFLVSTIAVYLAFKELRSSLSGRLLISYLFSLAVGYTIITFINISRFRFGFIECSLLGKFPHYCHWRILFWRNPIHLPGFTCYFFLMAAFLWLGVLCFDIWINFNESSVERDRRQNTKYFLAYSLYVWLSAGIATGILIYIESSAHIDELYKPGIGTKMCWLNSKYWFYRSNESWFQPEALLC